jgi:hypothetical protein
MNVLSIQGDEEVELTAPSESSLNLRSLINSLLINSKGASWLPQGVLKFQERKQIISLSHLSCCYLTS